MNYKTIFKSQEVRFKILSILRFIPSNIMVKLQYYLKLGRIPNINQPKRFTEKLQWYKLEYKNPLVTLAADKYNVRKYLKEKNLEHLLVDLYGVYEDPHKINYADLPQKFVMKTTNGSGTNILCTDKEKLDIDEVNEKMGKWLKRDYYAAGREWSYKNITPKIIIEEFLESETTTFDGINDYKFLCFNGNPEYIILDVDRQSGHKRNLYDTEWNYLNIKTDKDTFGNIVEQPKKLEEMLKVAKILSEDFPFVRVDLYSVNDKIYFGELTFYPWTGYVQFEPDDFDYELGIKFKLPKIEG